jgi:hypothetical protein
VACEEGGGAERKDRIRRFEVGIPRDADSELVDGSAAVEMDRSAVVSPLLCSIAKVGRAVDELDE